jgi:tetratricopeptide (TPR) repeat protein
VRRSTSVYTLVGVFLLAFLGIAALKGTRTAQDGPAPGSVFSEARKAQIAAFWEAYRRASERRQAGDLEAAVPAYREALRLDARHEDTLYYLGNALFDLGRYEEALAAFRQLIAVNPLSARAHFQAGAVLSCPEPGAPFDLEAAEQEFRRTLEINREESEPLVRLGEVALARGDLDAAEAHLTGAVRLNAKAAGAYYLLGYIRWTRGDRAGAAALLHTALRQKAPEKPAHGVLGEGDRRQPHRPGEVRRQSLFAPFVEAGLALSADEAACQTVYPPLARFCEDIMRTKTRRIRKIERTAHGT